MTRDLWYHGFDHYMTHAFPLDELSPLSCSGNGPDWENPSNIARNDVSGNFSLTLIDVIDTLVVIDDRRGFQNAVRNIIDWVSFDVNTKPQVFETTIRVLGGLLSGHMYASQPNQPFYLPWYRGELLEMAHDLGNRLLPAFATPTGIPYARLNLRHGVLRGETLETCTAGAGSLILEFATLSRLTGDDRFEQAAYKAFFALWNRKSSLGLVGNTINIWTGTWTQPEITGIGAGIDSFYEYALKWYILSGEIEFLDVWQEAYAAVMRYARSPDGHWYRNVNLHTGDIAYASVDSLSAFWPGLQVLAGDIPNAIKSHLLYWNIWKRHSGLPEVWDAGFMQATSFQFPLRPEFVESTWYLYRATRDTFYLDVGKRILEDITIRAKVDCGLTGIKDLRTNARDDRMESFVLSETLKYLYLLFDEENRLHTDDSNYVFTTEGHILSLPADKLKPLSAVRRRMRRLENHQCPAYRSKQTLSRHPSQEGLVQGINYRDDIDYSRHLVGSSPQSQDELHWSPDGWCALPDAKLYSYDFVLSHHGIAVREDINPTTRKLKPVDDGFVLQNISGIRTRMVSRLDGLGYDITKLGPYAVRTGQVVYVNDTSLSRFSVAAVSNDPHRSSDVELRIFLEGADVTSGVSMTGYRALFGGEFLTNVQDDIDTSLNRRGEGLHIRRDRGNILGCEPYSQSLTGDAVIVSRGDCSFLEKLVRAQDAGARGLVVVSDSDLPIQPSAGIDEIEAAGDLSEVGLVLVTQTTGQILLSMMDQYEGEGMEHLLIAIHSENKSTVADQKSDRIDEEDDGQILYINGHPLINTRLLI
ncbi:glycoside hydrolase family 47 protein [Serpula lacrymans var. lacrymans S7.3]|uniref:alpha-1,2-Mannosidase n=2 Tax=Serpula lacrymans var. lacrymans TaxID=341189 RepID=F8PNT8_SERL3|nr:glycoside hydrolase family 47 protein [Serpula lacrymans var. lacrymans S7.9]EGO01815.1 glycoside hydrolase family 47 protein [Serpula lacrymans var. lacrymans S7.3]EGO27446.1 glycoside hydrolase family 47 protein [Serpula lacrymans var. lacrymans S7.9]